MPAACCCCCCCLSSSSPRNPSTGKPPKPACDSSNMPAAARTRRCRLVRPWSVGLAAGAVLPLGPLPDTPAVIGTRTHSSSIHSYSRDTGELGCVPSTLQRPGYTPACLSTPPVALATARRHLPSACSRPGEAGRCCCCSVTVAELLGRCLLTDAALLLLLVVWGRASGSSAGLYFFRLRHRRRKSDSSSWRNMSSSTCRCSHTRVSSQLQVWKQLLSFGLQEQQLSWALTGPHPVMPATQ